MRKILFHGLWLCTGLLFFVSGFFCLIHPEVTLSSMAILLGIALIISGINDIIGYINIHHNMTDSGWILMEGIMAILFGVFCLFHHFITALTIPIIFSVWVIYVGLTRVISSFNFKAISFSNWWLLLVFGILLIILGIMSLMDPLIASIAISTMLGIILISQSFSCFTKWYFMTKLLKRFRELFK
ncbi:MAG: hypothetical protein HFI09_03065 [Bacilli bacterium]|nr:hypothetical protein [Bacilli bacterium]